MWRGAKGVAADVSNPEDMERLATTAIEPSEGRPGNLYEPAVAENLETGGYEGHVLRSSRYTQFALSPARALLAAGLGLALFAGIRSLTNSGDE